MARRELTAVGGVVAIVLVAVGAAAIFGYPNECPMVNGVVLSASCKPVSLSHWWDGGAQISAADIHDNLFGVRSYNQDFINSAFDHVLEWFADRGRQIWNPVAKHLLIRVVICGLVLQLIYDLLKAGYKALFTTGKTAADPPKPQTRESDDSSKL